MQVRDLVEAMDEQGHSQEDERQRQWDGEVARHFSARDPFERTPSATAAIAPRPWIKKKPSCHPSKLRSTGRKRYSCKQAAGSKDGQNAQDGLPPAPGRSARKHAV